ncbi:MAG: hypothetical protein ACI9K2_000426 [Myxococcota bacterium]|jgi:hypothetical protein
MAQWLVLKGKNNQFKADGMRELKKLAQSGELRLGDLIQPPGTSEWLYVDEVADLKKLCPPDDDYDDGTPSRGRAAMITAALAAVFSIVIVVGGGVMWMSFQELPSGNERLIGEGGLSFSEMIVTETGTGLRSSADANASVATTLRKNEILVLLSKRGDFYKARSEAGAEGWIPFDHVIPMYQLGGVDVRTEFDPLYNPDRYFEIANASWQQLPDAEEGVTVFQFFLSNSSSYDMTDLIILATVKDARGHELERVEIPVEGVIPPGGRTMVGTLRPKEVDEDGRKIDEEDLPPARTLTEHTFALLAEDDPELQLNYSAGVEVILDTQDFTNASIDPLELRAVPTDEALKKMKRK